MNYSGRELRGDMCVEQSIIVVELFVRGGSHGIEGESETTRDGIFLFFGSDLVKVASPWIVCARVIVNIIGLRLPI